MPVLYENAFNIVVFMKKSSIIKVCSGVIVIIGILILVSLFLSGFESGPHFKFLDGNGTLTKVEEHDSSASKVKEIFFSCSFEGDFNGIFAKANTELKGLGYVLSDYPNKPPGEREYEWNHPNIDEVVLVMENHELEVFPDEKNSGQLDSDYKYREGWITVIVYKNQKKNWLIYKLDLLLDKLRNKK